MALRLSAAGATPQTALPVGFIELGHGAAKEYIVRTAGATARFRRSAYDISTSQGRLTVEFAGSRMRNPRAAGVAEGRANFLIGQRNHWLTDLPVFRGIRYKNLYEGIDACFSGHGRLLKSEFHVAPWAEAGRIRIRYRGAIRISITPNGSLVVETPTGVLREAPPAAYQIVEGRRVAVDVSYHHDVSSGTVGFALGQYDHGLPLVVDPVFVYSTFLGGGRTDYAYGVAVDSTGAAYVVGTTDSVDFPTTAPAFQRQIPGGVSAFIAKVNPAGAALLYCTYLGGPWWTEGLSIAVDSGGSAVVTGSTTSRELPIVGGIQSTHGGGARDAFVAKLNPTGSGLVWSTYLGGSLEDTGNSIAVDSSGNTYVTGFTTSANFPVASPYRGTYSGGQDAFVVKINAAGSALVYSTYLGGTGEDRGSGVAVDSSGSAYVGGRTNSTDFPVVNGFQSALSGSYDLFVSKLSPTGGALTYSTYLGGSRSDSSVYGSSIAVDASGSAYIVGSTLSPNFPLASPIQATLRNGMSDVVVAKLAPNGGSLAYSTYLGGGISDDGDAIAVDSAGRAYVTGSTISSDFPVVNASSTYKWDGDVFVTRLSPSGAFIERSEFVGGVGGEEAYGIAVDASGGVYVAGATGSGDFPLQTPIQSSNGGNTAAFLFKLGNPGPPSAVSVSPATGSGASATLVLTYSDPDGFSDITTASALVQTSASTASACYVRYTRATNLLELSNDTGTGWVGSTAPGSAGTLENSQCVLNAASSSAAGAGPNLTVSVALIFRGTFGGAKNVYLNVSDSGGTFTGWQSRGAWTVTEGGTVPNVLVSVKPSSGSGAQQSFQFVYSSIYGFQDVKWAFLNISSSGGSANACMARYIQATNQVELSTNDAGDWVARGTPGAQVLLENSQCRINLALSSVAGAGSTLTLTLSITFKSGYTGNKGLYMASFSNTNILTNWTSMGTFNVLFNYPPVPVLVAPAGGSGASQVFEFAYSDQNGYADIVWSAMLIHASLTPLNSCLFRFTRATNVLELANDAGAFTNSLTMGFAGTIQNSQCSVDGGASAVILAGNSLSVRVAVSFKPGYTGAKSVFSTAGDVPGNVAAWTALGTWTVP